MLMFRPILRECVDQSLHAHSLYGEAVTSMMRTNLVPTLLKKKVGHSRMFTKVGPCPQNSKNQ